MCALGVKREKEEEEEEEGERKKERKKERQRHYKINVSDKNRKFSICCIIRFPKKLGGEMPSPREKKRIKKRIEKKRKSEC